MRSIFDRLARDWPQLDRSVHVYALPDPADAAFRAAVAPYQEAVRRSGVAAVQPPEFLHATITRTPAFLGDGDQPGTDRLPPALAAVAARHRPFTLTLQRPRPHGEALVAVADPSPEWDALLADVRAAVAAAFPGEPLPGAPHAPHVSLGYGTRDTDEARLLAELDRLADDVRWDVALPVATLHLLSVDGVPDPGLFRWQALAAFPLAGY